MDWNNFVQQTTQIAALVRDLGLIIGLPVIIVVITKLYTMQVNLVKERQELLNEKSELLRDTQYDKALSQIKAQRELYEIERTSLEQEITGLRGSLSAKQVEIENVQNRLAAAKKEKSTYEIEHETLESDIENLEKTLESKQNEIISFQEKLGEVNEKISVLSTSFELMSKPESRFTPLDICGIYKIQGSNPDVQHNRQLKFRKNLPEKINYTGTLTIKKFGQNYQLKWVFDAPTKQQAEGTGILTKNILSAVFKTSKLDNSEWWGIVNYEIKSPGNLTGYFAGFDETLFGKEICNRIEVFGN